VLSTLAFTSRRMPYALRRKGWIDPRLPAADHQNDVLGAAVASAAIQFAEGGYTVLLDGTFFPAGIEGDGIHVLTPRSPPALPVL
jgi:hypothetical protein